MRERTSYLSLLSRALLLGTALSAPAAASAAGINPQD